MNPYSCYSESMIWSPALEEVEIIEFMGYEFFADRNSFGKWRVVHVSTCSYITSFWSDTKKEAIEQFEIMWKNNIGRVPFFIEDFFSRYYTAIDYVNLLTWNIL